jgi:D-3-phosphoglycerate dehydrogenase
MDLATDPLSYQVCLFDGVSPSGREAFEKAGFKNITCYPDSLPPSELKPVIKNAHIVGIRSKTALTKEILEEAENLICVGRYGIGVNNVDLDFAQEKGIAVFNGPHASTRSVAELVIGHVFTLLRKIAESSRRMHSGQWPKSSKGCREIRGKTLGLIGYGNISTQVSVMAEALGMQVIYSDIVKVLPLGNAQQVTLEEVLKKSDIISLHVPGVPSTQNMINAQTIAQMKDGAYLINTSRGSVVDIDAVKEALESGKLGGVALDVFPVEPKSKKEAFISPLQDVSNAVFTPHIAGSTEESQTQLGTEVSEKMIRCALLADTSTSLNLPQLMQRPIGTNCRLVVIHKNKAGVLSHILEIIAEEDINIVSETLQTKGEIGMATIDLNACLSAQGLKKIAELETTVSVRNCYQDSSSQ